MEKTNYKNASSTDSQEIIKDEIDLKDLWNGIFRKKKWFALTSGIVFFGSVLFTINERIFNPSFRGSFTLLINDPMDANKADKGLDSSLFLGIVDSSSEYEINTLITFLKSPVFLEPIAKEFNLSTGFLQRSISINQFSEATQRSKGILNVVLNFKNKKIGEKILTTLSEDYLKASLDQKQKRLKDGLKFLDAQAPEVQKRKDELQSQIVNFRERNKMILPEIESGTLKEQQFDLEQQIRLLNTERKKLKDVRNEIEEGTLTARGLSQELGDGLSISDFDQGLLQELINVENELAQAKSKYTSNSSIVRGLNQRLEKIQPLLLKNQLEAVDTALKLNSGNLNALKKIKEEIETQFLDQPLLIKKFENLDQELRIANENLLSLISARESFQLEMAQNAIPWRIISKPTMGSVPTKPNIKLNLFFGLIGGIIAGAIAAIIRDKKDHFFYSALEIKKEINETQLAHLPHVDIFKNLRSDQASILDILNEKLNDEKINSKKDNYQRFFFQEAFRNLYTSIRFLNTSDEVKTLLLTSSLPKEGKTLTNILLAKTLADLGVKLLLIDADLRKPQVHYRLGLNNLKGFSNLLSDPNIKVDSVKNKIKNYENWDVITGGTLPPDPTRLLGSDRFKKIINEIKKSEKYEFILIDAPPILGLSDSLLISECTDGVILLVGIGAVDRSLPKESINKIKNIGSNFYGLVTNQTIQEKIKSDNDTYAEYSNEYAYAAYASYGNTENFDSKVTLNNDIDTENSSQDNLNKEGLNNFKKALIYIKEKTNIVVDWLEK